MKFISLLFVVFSMVATLLLGACENYSPGTGIPDSVITEPASTVALPKTMPPLDLTMTPEMLEQFIVETGDVVTENQAQLQLQAKKEDDIQFNGRLLLEPRENALMPLIDGAMVEIAIKTQSP